jgi:hypothetical protein
MYANRRSDPKTIALYIERLLGWGNLHDLADDNRRLFQSLGMHIYFIAACSLW